jgi:hypothetical protein
LPDDRGIGCLERTIHSEHGDRIQYYHRR